MKKDTQHTQKVVIRFLNKKRSDFVADLFCLFTEKNSPN